MPGGGFIIYLDRCLFYTTGNFICAGVKTLALVLQYIIIKLNTQKIDELFVSTYFSNGKYTRKRAKNDC